MCFDIVCWAR
jgi:hypothetical protein